MVSGCQAWEDPQPWKEPQPGLEETLTLAAALRGTAGTLKLRVQLLIIELDHDLSYQIFFYSNIYYVYRYNQHIIR